MPLTPFTIQDFGGLNFIDSPEVVGAHGATAMTNVDLAPGKLFTRSGWTPVTVAGTVSPSNLAWFDSSADHILAQTNTNETTAFSLDTGVATATIADRPIFGSYASFSGDPAHPKIHMAGFGGVQTFNGSTWTTQPYSAQFVAVTPRSNRFVRASGGTCEVTFSDPGDETTYTANNFVDLQQGDGSYQLSAMLAWRDYLFVFKLTRFFVFGDESVDGAGKPIFNYRTVDVGIGAALGGACVGREGIYFHDGEGIYVTAGDAPVYLSRAIEPWLKGQNVSTGLTFNLESSRLTYSQRRLYVNDTSTGLVLVLDTQLNAWMLWDIGATGIVAVPYTTARAAGVYFGQSGVKKVASLTGTTDNGTDISWSYRSGKYAISDPGRVAITRESSVTAYSDSGTVTLDLSTEKQATTGGAALTVGLLSTSPQEGYFNFDYEGKLFRHSLTGTGPGAVKRVTHYVSSVKPPGIQ